jgi:hypothetical protein
VPTRIVRLLLAVALSACGSRTAAKEMKPMAARRIEEVLAAHNESLMARAGVVGTAIGLCDGTPCIRVFVADGPTAQHLGLGPRLEGYPLRVEVTGPLRARKDARTPRDSS